MIRIENLLVKRQKKIVLDSISCTFNPGKITLLIGNSGAGKTTILQSIAGLFPIEQGSIFIDKKNIQLLSHKERSENIGYVFQQFNLFPHLTALENCIDPLLVHGANKQEAITIVSTYFTQFDIQELMPKYPSQLSGGQQQRVAVIRALVLQPKALLLDEPSASLDPNNTNILVSMLKTIAKKGITIIASSQDTYFTKKAADTICYIEHGTIKEWWNSQEGLDTTSYIGQFLNQENNVAQSFS